MNPMKKIYLSLIAVLLVVLTAVSCQQEDGLKGNVGYLRIAVGTNAYVDTRSVPEEYNPEQIALQILDSKNEVVQETDDWEELKEEQIRLAPGTYTIKASSNGFDGSESGFDIPYYAGSQQVTIESGKEVTANITCTLANVKVTVNYDESFQKFASATVTVASELEGIGSLDFKMGDELKPGYFPVGDLKVTVKVTNESGTSHSQTTEITGVKARKHYILNFKVAEAGGINKPNVTINGEEFTYTFQFNVATEVTTQLEAEPANAWSNFAYVEGCVLSAESELDPVAMHFEYKKADASEWTTVSATHATDTYKATLSNLTPATKYSYRMVYQKDADTYTSNEVTFTTESAVELPNGNMDNWYQSDGVWYAASESEYNSTGSFWDSGNKGTSLIKKNPTQGNSSVVHTSNGKSAELKSQYALIKFAAGNLYVGEFGGLHGMDGASINFGQKFESRPKSLHGWFNYTSGKINYRGDNTPQGMGEKDSDDLCSIYIAIAKERILVDNTDISTFPNWETDERVIAYNRLNDTEAVSTNGWKEFTLDFKYRNIEPQSTYYLIIVFSASKYGDYYTGSDSSVMYVDDLELIYGEPVTE